MEAICWFHLLRADPIAFRWESRRAHTSCRCITWVHAYTEFHIVIRFYAVGRETTRNVTISSTIHRWRIVRTILIIGFRLCVRVSGDSFVTDTVASHRIASHRIVVNLNWFSFPSSSSVACVSFYCFARKSFVYFHIVFICMPIKVHLLSLASRARCVEFICCMCVCVFFIFRAVEVEAVQRCVAKAYNSIEIDAADGVRAADDVGEKARERTMENQRRFWINWAQYVIKTTNK